MLESQLNLFLMVHYSIQCIQNLHVEKIFSCAMRCQPILLWQNQSETTYKFTVSDG